MKFPAIIKKSVIIIIIFLLFLAVSYTLRDSIKKIRTHTVKIVFVGDIMGHSPQILSAYDEKRKIYDYWTNFLYIKDYLSDADIAAGNIELTFAGLPYSGFPKFSSPDDLASALKYAGFDLLFTANNHSLDRGEAGLLRTLDIIDNHGFLRAGTYRDIFERTILYPLIVEKNRMRIAFLNYTYSTNENELQPPCLINMLDPVQIEKDVYKADRDGADFKIAYVHWGKEYEREENPEQSALAYMLISYGIDAVIGTHPHVVQPVRYMELETKPGKKFPVAYSLGNFISNQRDRHRDGGIALELHLTKYNNIAKLEKIEYLPFWVHKKYFKTGKYIYYIIPVRSFESNSLKFDLSDNERKLIEQFSADTRAHLKGLCESGYYMKKESE